MTASEEAGENKLT